MAAHSVVNDATQGVSECGCETRLYICVSLSVWHCERMSIGAPCGCIVLSLCVCEVCFETRLLKVMAMDMM